MKDLTTGKPIKVILMFAIPILIGNIFQQLYGIVDTRVVGQYLGLSALASVGATSSISNFIVGFVCGMTTGFCIKVANHYGGKDYATMRKSVAGTIVLSMGSAIFMTTVGILGIRKLLVILGTPADILDMAEGYIKIIIWGIVFTVIYNMCANILRAIGDSITPLVFLVIAVIGNIVLDVTFIKYLGFGVNAAAYATIISQGLSAFMCIVFMIKKYPILRLKAEDFQFGDYNLGNLFATGLSMGFMLCIVNIGSVILQSSVNGLGTNIVAGHTVSRKMFEMMAVPSYSISMTMATYTSQNLGAKKIRRIREGLISAIGVCFIWSTIVIIISYTIGPNIAAALTGTGNQEVVDTAALYMRINLPFYYALCVLVVLRNCMQGLGRTIIPLVSSTVELVGKVVAVLWLTPVFGYVGVSITEPITWIACSVVLIIALIIKPFPKIEEEKLEIH